MGSVAVSLQLDPRRQPIGGEAPRDPLKQLERLVFLPAVVQEPRQRHGGIGARWLEFEGVTQRLFVTLGDKSVRL